MRLICPNCGAQYEVEDNVIPDDGRDVQCSNCGHTWFQRPAHLDRDLADELNQDIAEGDEDGKAKRERRGLDPEVADVLREEAEHEAAARKAESGSLETQGDLGLDEAETRAASRSAAARARMARLRGADEQSPEAAAAALAAASASRRDLLPDIEEINSSLRASQDREEAPDDEDTPAPEIVKDKDTKRGGFRLGFTLMLLLAVIAVTVYVLAPQIGQVVPGAEPYLAAYVEQANGLRLRSGEMVELLINQVKGLTGSDG